MPEISKKRRLIRMVLIGMTGVIGAGLVASWIVAGALIAAAPSHAGQPPTDLNVTAVTIPSDSGATLQGWHTQASGSHGVIVLLHGIRGSRREMLERARLLDERGYSTVMIDLQAHGESSGNSITIGHLERHDARAAVQFARREHPHEPIGVIGISLGGAAAVLASPLDVDAVVLESVYTDIRHAIQNRVAARVGSLLATIPAQALIVQLQPRLGIAPSQLRPIDHISEVGYPVCVVSGTADLHTTAAETELLFAAAREPKELWLVEGAAHVDLLEFAPDQYRERIGGFFERHFPTRGRHSDEQSR